jgi:hypothetical protein
VACRCRPSQVVAKRRSSFRNLQHVLVHKLVTFSANCSTLGPRIVLTRAPTAVPRDELSEGRRHLPNSEANDIMDRDLYSITEARERLGGISRNSIYALLNSGELASVVLGCRRFITAAAIADLIARSTTTASPALDAARDRQRNTTTPTA